jgi:hypothetical protein
MKHGALYNRAVQVIVGTPSTPALATWGNVGLESSPLRIGFEVKKNLKSAPNTASITIYNISGRTRSVMYPGMIVTLSAGYQGQIQALFIGVVDKIKSSRAGTDIATVLDCLDGAAAVGAAFLHRSYSEGSALADVLHDVAASMQLVTAANPTGVTAGISIGIPNDRFPFGYVASGMCRDILNELCKPRGLEWSIQDGALQIMPKTHGASQTAELVSAQTGLTGTPSLSKDLLEFTCLLNPRIAPGRMIFLEGRDIQGFFKVRGGTWSGDTHDQKWEASIQAINTPHFAEVFNFASGVSIA